MTGIDVNAVYGSAAAAEAHRHPGGQVTVGNTDFDFARVRRNARARGPDPDVPDGFRGNVLARDPTRDMRIQWRRDGADGPIPARAWITASRGPSCDTAVTHHVDADVHTRARVRTDTRPAPHPPEDDAARTDPGAPHGDADHPVRAVDARVDRIARIRFEPLATHELHERAEASAGMRARPLAEPLISKTRRYAVHADGTEHDACERVVEANARLHATGRTPARIVAGIRAVRARTTPRGESRRRHPAGRCVPPGHMFRRHVVRQQVRQEG